MVQQGLVGRRVLGWLMIFYNLRSVQLNLVSSHRSVSQLGAMKGSVTLSALAGGVLTGISTAWMVCSEVGFSRDFDNKNA